MRKSIALVLAFAACSACEYSLHVADIRPDTARPDGGSLASTPVAGDDVTLFATGTQVLDSSVLFADLDEDGLDDIVIADRGNSDAYGTPFRGGGLYIVYGRAARIGPRFDLDAGAAHIIGPTHEAGGDGLIPVRGDFDGDGHPDLAIAVGGEGGPGTLHVLYGAGTRLSGTMFIENVATTLTGPDFFGETLGNVGDLDHDGCDELAVGGANIGAMVLRGSRVRWTSATAATVFSGTSYAMAQSAGDLDADGELDVIVTHEDGNIGVFYGPIALSGTHAAPDATLALGGGGYWPGILAGVDLDQDGYADIAAPDLDGSVGAVTIFLGGPRQMVGTYVSGDAPLRLIAEPSTGGMLSISAGDADGDGHRDLLVGVPGTASGDVPVGRAYRIPGPIVGGELAHAPVVWSGAQLTPPWGPDGERLGNAVAQDGDFDGDGLADAIIAAPTSAVGAQGEHVVYLSYGRAS